MLLDKVHLAPPFLPLQSQVTIRLQTYVRMCAIYQYAFVFFSFSELFTHTLTVIHSVLTLAIQNGAFLHLVVTLAAIIARLAHLSTSLRRALSSLHAECLHLFDKLYVRGEQPVVI